MQITKTQLAEIVKEELNEVYSEKQRRWACAQTGDDFKGERSLNKAEAEEMCKGPMKERFEPEPYSVGNLSGLTAEGDPEAEVEIIHRYGSAPFDIYEAYTTDDGRVVITVQERDQ
jgi:hypothetical protein